MVIDIILDNGKKLLLDAETQIEWVRENMFFEKDVQLRGKYSYPFTINREANSEPLNFPDIIEAAVSDIKLGCRVLIYGTEFYKGQINVLDWDDGIINISITRDTTAFDTDQYIDELDLGEYADGGDLVNINANAAKVYPEVDFVFPQFYNNNGDNIEKVGSQNLGADYIIVNWRNGNTEEMLANDIPVPMFYLLGVLEKTLNNFGIALKSSLRNDANFIKKIIFNNCVLDTTPIDINSNIICGQSLDSPFVSIYCYENLNMGPGVVYSLKVVEWNNSAIVNQFNVTYTVSPTDIAGGTTAILQALRDEILASATNTVVTYEDYGGTISTANPFGFNIEFNTGNKISFTTQSNNITKVTQLTSVNYRTLLPLLKNGVNLLPYNKGVFDELVIAKKHVPHITVSEFLNSLKNMFNLSIELDEAKDIFYIEFRKSLINTMNIKDFTGQLIEGNEGVLETPENIVIELNNDSSNDETAKWESITANNYPQAALEPSVKIQTNCGAPKVELLRNSNSGFRNQAIVGNLFGSYLEPEDFGLRFLHCHGYVADSNGFKSVFADRTGLTPNEVYTEYYKDWYEFVYSLVKAPTYYFDFGMIELKQQLPTIWRVKYTEFVWKRMTTIIHNTKGILPTKVEGYRKA